MVAGLVFAVIIELAFSYRRTDGLRPAAATRSRRGTGGRSGTAPSTAAGRPWCRGSYRRATACRRDARAALSKICCPKLVRALGYRLCRPCVVLCAEPTGRRRPSASERGKIDLTRARAPVIPRCPARLTVESGAFQVSGAPDLPGQRHLPGRRRRCHSRPGGVEPSPRRTERRFLFPAPAAAPRLAGGPERSLTVSSCWMIVNRTLCPFDAAHDALLGCQRMETISPDAQAHLMPRMVTSSLVDVRMMSVRTITPI